MKLNTTRYTLSSEKLPKEFDGFRMAVLSDLHDTVYGEENIKLYERIAKEQPDVVLIAGDLITGLKSRDYTPAIKLLSKLSESFQVYYGLGNHEVRGFDNIKKYLEVVKKLPNVHILDNDCVALERKGTSGEAASIVIAGLSLAFSYYSKGLSPVMEDGYISSELGEKADRFTIMLAHFPDYFKNYAKWGADVVFSGHLHGGLIRLPLIGGLVSPQIKLFPKYDKGVFVEGESSMIVSAGLGTHTMPRIFNPAELLIVDIFTIEKK